MMASPELEKSERRKCLNRLCGLKIDTIYLMDSFGTLLPNKTREIFAEYADACAQSAKTFGAHFHNNLQCAFANSLAAIEAGAKVVDATIGGLGKGAGNCPTELLAGAIFGADAALHITPYYNKPTQEGLYQHFKTICSEVSMPIILYNVPGRTGCNMLPSTVARIARDVPDVVGIKEATADLIHVSDLVEQCPEGFQVLSGDDFTVLPHIAVGGCGVISVTANVAPKLMADLCKATLAGDMDEARRLHFRLMPINRAMFLETNPIPVKTAVCMMRGLDLEFRLPMVPLMPDNLEKLTKTLNDGGLRR